MSLRAWVFVEVVLGRTSEDAFANFAAGVRRDAGENGTLRGMLPDYGAFGGDRRTETYRRSGRPGYMPGGRETDDFRRNYLGDRFGERDRLAVPACVDLAGLSPAFKCVADCDVPYDGNVGMDRRLRAAGVAAAREVHPGTSHGVLEAVSVSVLAEWGHRDGAAWSRRSLG